MTLGAILFDMDGVVIDTHEPVTRFWNDLATTYNIMLTPSDFEAHIYGVPAIRTFDLLFPMITGEARKQVLAELEQDELTQQYTPIAGVVNFLQAVKLAQIPTALVTSGEHWKVKRVFDQLGLHPLFATSVTASDVVQGKPAPDCYLLAAQRLGVAIQHCIVFEDSLAGATAGLAAGAQVIGVQAVTGLANKLRKLGVKQIIADFSQLNPEIVTNIKGNDSGDSHSP